MFAAFSEYEGLLREYCRFKKSAEALKTPNEQDDCFVRMAITGFSVSCRTEEWDLGHFNVIKVRRAGDFSDQAAAECGGPPIAAFGCLCLGYIMGLYQSKALSADEFKIADAHIAGYIALHRNDILNADALCGLGPI
jgi:hypothetical protein